MNTISINYLAVIVSGILAMPIGALWYGPLFSKSWMKEVGYTEEDLKKDFNPGKTYGLAVVGHILMAFVLAYLFALTGAETMMRGFQIGISAWFGFIFLTMFINGLFERRSFKLLMINSGYQLVNIIVFTIVLILWR